MHKTKCLLLLSVVGLMFALGGCSMNLEEATTYSVYFHDADIETMRVVSGQVITDLEEPVREGYDFDGWYKDINYGEPFNMKTAIRENTVLYAKWIPLEGFLTGEYFLVGTCNAWDFEEALPLVRNTDTPGILTYEITITAEKDDEFKIVNDPSWNGENWGIAQNSGNFFFKQAGTYKIVFTPEDLNAYGRNILVSNMDPDVTDDPNVLTGTEGLETVTYYYLSPYDTDLFNVYLWNDSGRIYEVWPGVPMELVDTLDSGLRVFKAEVPANIYTWIKFADPSGNPKTNNIPLDGFADQTCFYFIGGEYHAFDYTTGEIPDIEITHVDYYFATDTDAETYYAYFWEDGGNELKKWPGTEMDYVETTESGYDIYRINVIEGDYDHVIFSGEDSSPKTENIPLEGVVDQTVFYIDGYSYDTYIYGTQDGPTEDEDSPDAEEEGMKIYYFETDTDYDAYYGYFWKDSGSNNASYPGQELTYVKTLENGSDLYVIKVVESRGWQYAKFSANDNELKSATIPLNGVLHRTVFYIDGDTYGSYLYDYEGDAPDAEEEGMKIYYFETDTDYDAYYGYFWKDSGSKNADYPGEELTYVKTLESGFDLYVIKVVESRGWQYAKFSANDNELKSATIPLNGVPHRTIFYIDGDTFGSYLYGEEKPEPNDGLVTYYFETDTAYDTYYGYFWKDSGSKNADYPGEALTFAETLDNGNDLYSIDLDAERGWQYAKFSANDNELKSATIPLEDMADHTIFYIDGDTFGSYLYGEEKPEPNDGLVTYYFATDTDASPYYAYLWHDDGDELESWPGQEMTYAETTPNGFDLYQVEVTLGAYDHAIFSGTGGSPKTANIPLAGFEDDTVFYIKGYGYDTYLYGTQDGPITDDDDPDAEEEGMTIYYFETDTEYEAYYGYFWKDSGSNNASYPGQELTFVKTLDNGNDLYVIKVDASRAWKYVIFSANDNELKTPNILLTDAVHRTVFDINGDSYVYAYESEAPDAEEEGMTIYYFETDTDYDAYYGYFWKDSGSKNASYPGEELTFVKTLDNGNDLYVIKVDTSRAWKYVIFSANENELKSPNILLTDEVHRTVFHIDGESYGSYVLDVESE